MRSTTGLDQALTWLEKARTARVPLSVGLLGNCATVLPELVRRGVMPDVVTDQTSAHDELHGYIPDGLTVTEAADLRRQDPGEYVQRSLDAMGRHVAAMLAMQRGGAVAFDYGNNLRAQAVRGGCREAFQIKGFVPEYIRPLFCRGQGPFRWVALSGDPRDIQTTDHALLELFPAQESLGRWIRLAQQQVPFQGLPARICWLGYGEREQAGLRFNQLVAQGKLQAPVVIGRDHLDCGSVASPYRETEDLPDGSDAIADWPILNALVNTASGATWVSVHHGGGVGIGNSLHAGMAIVADGTCEADRRLQRVLSADPTLGVLRHADAGCEEALVFAQSAGLRLPIDTGAGNIP
jgi:urocanate hydratase